MELQFKPIKQIKATNQTSDRTSSNQMGLTCCLNPKMALGRREEDSLG